MAKFPSLWYFDVGGTAPEGRRQETTDRKIDVGKLSKMQFLKNPALKNNSYCAGSHFDQKATRRNNLMATEGHGPVNRMAKSTKMQTYLNICVILITFLKTLNAHPKGKNVITDDQTPDESDWSKRSDNSKIIHAAFPEIPKKAEDFLETFSEDGEERIKIKWDKYDEEIASVNNQEHGRSILSASSSYGVSGTASESADDQMENEKTLDERKVHRNYIEIDRNMYQCEDFYASLWEDNDELDNYSKIAQIGNSSNEITTNNEEEPDVHSKRSETSMIVRQTKIFELMENFTHQKNFLKVWRTRELQQLIAKALTMRKLLAKKMLRSRQPKIAANNSPKQYGAACAKALESSEPPARAAVVCA
uniref:Uncharacterized protein n=1 Tax=Globodera rostochiensis TaxID=31243 RepID=A0A914HCF9_GLORO